jgi:hypothetical protein
VRIVKLPADKYGRVQRDWYDNLRGKTLEVSSITMGYDEPLVWLMVPSGPIVSVIAWNVERVNP